MSKNWYDDIPGDSAPSKNWYDDIPGDDAAAVAKPTPSLRQRMQAETNDWESQQPHQQSAEETSRNASASALAERYRLRARANQDAGRNLAEREHIEREAGADRSLGEVVGDTALALGTGVRQLPGAVAGLVAPDSGFAKRNQDAVSGMNAQMSPTMQASLALERPHQRSI